MQVRWHSSRDFNRTEALFSLSQRCPFSINYFQSSWRNGLSTLPSSFPHLLKTQSHSFLNNYPRREGTSKGKSLNVPSFGWQRKRALSQNATIPRQRHRYRIENSIFNKTISVNMRGNAFLKTSCWSFAECRVTFRVCHPGPRTYWSTLARRWNVRSRISHTRNYAIIIVQLRDDIESKLAA